MNKPHTEEHPMKRRLSKTAVIALALLGVAVALIAVGVALGQPVQVWQKAAVICFECIGLG